MLKIKLLICFCLLFSSQIFAQKFKLFPNRLVRDSTKVELSILPIKSISFYYSGCTGFLIRKGNDAVLNDPFFSNLGPLSVLPLKKLATDTVAVANYFKKNFGQNADEQGIVKALLATHTHYDHVLDIPHIYHSKLNRDTVLVLGSAGLKTLLKIAEKHYQTKINQANIKVIDKGLAADSAQKGTWFYTQNRHIRILPILTDHAPHFFGLKLYKGQIDSILTKIPTNPNAYKEGQSLSYLIDFLKDNGQPDFRIYIQGSSNSPSVGFPPTEILTEKQIDVAILCVASFAYVNEHPETILKQLKPKFALLSHWENFFKPQTSLKIKPQKVPFTNVEHFLQKLQKTIDTSGQKIDWLLPNLETKMTFVYD